MAKTVAVYLGQGTEHYGGVPGRDLDEDEWNALPEEAKATMYHGSLYRLRKPAREEGKELAIKFGLIEIEEEDDGKHAADDDEEAENASTRRAAATSSAAPTMSGAARRAATESASTPNRSESDEKPAAAGDEKGDK